MFSPFVQKSEDLDKEIEAAFEIYGGKSLPYDWSGEVHNFSTGGGASGTRKDGIWVDKIQTMWVRNLSIDNGSVFELVCIDYEVYEVDETRLGLKKIVIRDISTSDKKP